MAECAGQTGPLEIRPVVYRHLVRIDEDGTVTELAREASHDDYCYDFCACYG